MAEAQALLLRNFRVGGSKPDACAQWLTEVTRALFKPIPFREVFVILALFLPQLTFAEGAKLDGKLWYSPAISSEESMIHVTPIAQGLQGMHEYKIAFASHSRAAAFVSPEQPVHSFESLATLPSEHIHSRICQSVTQQHRKGCRSVHHPPKAVKQHGTPLNVCQITLG